MKWRTDIFKQKYNLILVYFNKGLSPKYIQGNTIFDSIRHYITLQVWIFSDWLRSKPNHKTDWASKKIYSVQYGLQSITKQ